MAVDADNTLEITPSAAFSVEKQTAQKFRVTIVNPDALIAPGTVPRFGKISLRIVSIKDMKDEKRFGAKIEGSASCIYMVSFKVSGGPGIDLSTTGSEYDASWTTSGSASVKSVEQRGSGLIVVRNTGADDPVALSLRLKAKDGSEELESGPVVVPACVDGKSKTVIETVTLDVPADQCLRAEVVTDVSCDKCGPLKVDFNVNYRNSCNKTVECNLNFTLRRYQNGNWPPVTQTSGQWVRVGPNRDYSADPVTLSYAPWFSPFRTTAPGMMNCRYVGS